MQRGRRAVVLVLLAPGFEEQDVAMVARTLRRAGLPVVLVGLTAGPLRGCYGVSLAPDKTLSEVQADDAAAVVLPGGSQAARQLNADPRVHNLLRRVMEQGGYLLALDAGYTVLHRAGALNPSEKALVIGAGTSWRGDAATTGRVVVEGQVIFGRDLGVAQESALTLAALLESGPWTR